ncbi:MAG: aspartyl protease family protein, partial [Candidatus Eremiobacteraeota bacterium]|nr:aspartyl protease family protein [Candidatus Eremiobacteraeota bacterium]
YDEHSAVTAGRYTTARTLAPEMRVGALRMRDVAMQIIPDGVIAVPGIRAVGLLGFDFLAELGVTIDYEHERVTVVPEPQYVAPAGAPVFALGVRIGRGVPMTDVAINGALSERFLLDTGGGGTFLIFDAFARKHPEALRDAGGGVKRARRFRGVGGAFDTQPYEIESVRLGALNFERFVGYRVTSSGSYQGTDDGVIGAEFLRLFTLGLDYANSRVYLVPNSDGRKAMGIKA